MKIPKIIFKIDSQQDILLAWQFFNTPDIAGTNFWKKGATAIHPELKKIESTLDKRKLLHAYSTNIYKKISMN